MNIRNKKNRLLFMLMIISILSTASYYSYKRHVQKQWEENDMDLNSIIKLPEKDVYQWEVNYDNVHLVLERVGESQARVIYPIEESIDFDNYLSNVKNFNSVSTYSKVEEGREAAKKWGIDFNKNYYKVYYKKDGQEKTETIYRGKRLEFIDGYYIYDESTATVYAAKFWVIPALQKTLADMRSKIVFRIDPYSFTSFSYGDFHATYDGQHWNVDGVEQEKVDSMNVAITLSKAATIEADEVYHKDEIKVDFSEQTSDVVTMSYKDKSGQINNITYLLKKTPGKIYMKISNDDNIYVVDLVYYDYFVKPKSYYIKQK